jgi:CRISPR-associated endonuclease/helicase Cas3
VADSPSFLGEKAFYAHTKLGRPPEEWEPLEDHLGNVARLAEGFASEFGAGDWAHLAGLWHDLGKYRESFQRYLKKVGGASEDGGCEECVPGRVDHSTVGAIHARDTLGHLGTVAAYIIAGHHAGLPDAIGDGRSLNSRLDRRAVLEDFQTASIPAEVLSQASPSSQPRSKDPREAHMWLRLLFSCLTDADFLATEKFMNPGQSLTREQQYPGIESLAAKLASHLDKTFASPTTEVGRIRAEVLSACIAGAVLEPGLFTLTVPTGGGKTLSAMAFALNHAKVWRKRRIVYAIPYTSIIEQTAKVFRDIFGDCVIEHHSNLDPDDPERASLRRRLAAENWDAPIVVTTNVQLFESLFGARTSRCRKLHNLVNSVVVLDEAQLLPPDFLDPIRHSMRVLAQDYGVTFVVSTATQPALAFDGARELAPDPVALHRRLRRVAYEWPTSTERRSWESIASEMVPLSQVLCVVNRRDDARALFELVRHEEGAAHLSALMCGAHRSEKIAEIKKRLKSSEPVRLVSTQLIEAGVDIDFPVVFRAFAGLDSIAQAAGRCNREGSLSGLGRVVVFNPPRTSPPGLLLKAEAKARELLAGRESQEIELSLFTQYFDLLYKQGVNSLDKHDILGLLGRDAHRMEVQFRTAAELFQLVDESGYSSVIVDWADGRDLIDELRRWGAERLRMRRLQRFVVNVPSWQVRKLQASGDVEEILPALFAVKPGIYDPEVGLRTDGREYEPDELIC